MHIGSLPREHSLPAFTVIFLIILTVASPVPSSPQVKDPLALSRQLIVVRSDGWDSSTGTLFCFERKHLGDTWEETGTSVAVNIGKAGMAWGAGLQGLVPPDGPQKHEGDGRSPAGVFRLGSVFGYAPPDSAQFVRMPYFVADSTCECVDDTSSEYYNSVIEGQAVARKEWNSSEKMGKSGIAYRWGVLIKYNTAPRIPGRGSCIFLHVSEGVDVPTTGCTAVDESRLLTIIGWLDPGKVPVIVQLPASEYARWSNDWRLPPLAP